MLRGRNHCGIDIPCASQRNDRLNVTRGGVVMLINSTAPRAEFLPTDDEPGLRKVSRQCALHVSRPIIWPAPVSAGQPDCPASSVT
jgi:hypothetical protein